MISLHSPGRILFLPRTHCTHAGDGGDLSRVCTADKMLTSLPPEPKATAVTFVYTRDGRGTEGTLMIVTSVSLSLWGEEQQKEGQEAQVNVFWQ